MQRLTRARFSNVKVHASQSYCFASFFCWTKTSSLDLMENKMIKPFGRPVSSVHFGSTGAFHWLPTPMLGMAFLQIKTLTLPLPSHWGMGSSGQTAPSAIHCSKSFTIDSLSFSFGGI